MHESFFDGGEKLKQSTRDRAWKIVTIILTILVFAIWFLIFYFGGATKAP